MGSGPPNGDPGKIHPIFYKGSSGRTTPLYNINKGKEDAKRRRGRLVLEFYIAFGVRLFLEFYKAVVVSRILQSCRHHNWSGYATLTHRFCLSLTIFCEKRIRTCTRPGLSQTGAGWWF